ncbi:GNAT family N-acetyltransferase [Ruminococcus flavefaciens]|uniref:Acetyltransferase (GNAT) family protein n=1 Tax=Ruminococcus flavefaciens TaxID=1265 RepID=A0A1M7GE25_RUMFL|nr:GNAT family N-acetyltransferase [Ruminococcus flavefaciens]SHM14207.1 Acetyltransferase (GNAT) family protein [Ruminococcus flavefaciens]
MNEIKKAEKDDLQEILQLQYLAYQSEAELFGSRDIPPLRQTLEEVIDEYDNGSTLKMVGDDGSIIGSVRAREQDGTVYIGKLMVHPDHRNKGLGTRLLAEIEKCFPNKRYELFTSTRSKDNIRLYEKNGYRIFARKAVNDELEFVYMEKEADKSMVVDELMMNKAYLIDIFPRTVQEKADNRYFDVEKYFRNNRDELDRSLTNILLKLYCYYDIIAVTNNGAFEINGAEKLVMLLEKYFCGENSYMNMILPGCGTLLTFNSDDLYTVVYTENDEAKELIAQLVRAEGLFFYEAPDK